MDEYSSIRNYISQFLSFTDEEWELHRSLLTRRWLKKGEFLLTAGQVCNHVSFINTGYFRVYNLIEGVERTNNFAFEGNYVTDYCSFLTRQPANDFIVALEDAQVLQLSYDHMQAAFEKSPVWQKFGRLIAEYIFIHASTRANSLLLKKPEELYLELMKERPKVIERIPLMYIASYLGITPEALSRIRKRLSEKPINSAN